MPQNTKIHDLTIDNSVGTRNSTALYIQGAQYPEVYRTTIHQGASGTSPISMFQSYVPFIHDNLVLTDQTGTAYAMLELGADYGGSTLNNRFTCASAGNTTTGITVAFGTYAHIVSGNSIDCASAGSIGVLEADNNTITNNYIRGSSAGIGLLGNNNYVSGNTATSSSIGIQTYASAFSSGGPAWAPNTSYNNSCVLEFPNDGWIFCEQGPCTSGS